MSTAADKFSGYLSDLELRLEINKELDEMTTEQLEDVADAIAALLAPPPAKR